MIFGSPPAEKQFRGCCGDSCGGWGEKRCRGKGNDAGAKRTTLTGPVELIYVVGLGGALSTRWSCLGGNNVPVRLVAELGNTGTAEGEKD